ncbi:MAG: isochorismatase family protein [Gammaproteobacteria bacterium]|nr:isochorismatase family protein [Gammaproteobacteria bacterium]
MNELDIYAKQGFGNSSGFGARPALLIVDFVIGFTDPEHFGGGNILSAVANTKTLLAAARAHSLPIAYTRIVYADHQADKGIFCLKAKGLEKFTEHAPLGQIVTELAPEPRELIVRKSQPSAFFGTSLAAWLISKAVDTVIVTGCTTSGCVRASVVDSMSHNFRTIVARDGVGDRALGPHQANLFDIEQKYADLWTCAEIATHLQALNQARES